jgi:hypothetical protein
VSRTQVKQNPLAKYRSKGIFYRSPKSRSCSALRGASDDYRQNSTPRKKQLKNQGAGEASFKGDYEENRFKGRRPRSCEGGYQARRKDCGEGGAEGCRQTCKTRFSPRKDGDETRSSTCGSGACSCSCRSS